MGTLPSLSRRSEATPWLAVGILQGTRGPGATLDRKPRRRFGGEPSDPPHVSLGWIPFRARAGAFVNSRARSRRADRFASDSQGGGTELVHWSAGPASEASIPRALPGEGGRRSRRARGSSPGRVNAEKRSAVGIARTERLTGVYSYARNERGPGELVTRRGLNTRCKGTLAE